VHQQSSADLNTGLMTSRINSPTAYAGTQPTCARQWAKLDFYGPIKIPVIFGGGQQLTVRPVEFNLTSPYVLYDAVMDFTTDGPMNRQLWKQASAGQGVPSGVYEFLDRASTDARRLLCDMLPTNTVLVLPFSAQQLTIGLDCNLDCQVTAADASCQQFPVLCDSIDFNNDGLFPDNQDLEDWYAVTGGGACSTGYCNDIDFNNDGLYPDNFDTEAFVSVFGGGACVFP